MRSHTRSIQDWQALTDKLKQSAPQALCVLVRVREPASHSTWSIRAVPKQGNEAMNVNMNTYVYVLNHPMYTLELRKLTNNSPADSECYPHSHTTTASALTQTQSTQSTPTNQATAHINTNTDTAKPASGCIPGHRRVGPIMHTSLEANLTRRSQGCSGRLLSLKTSGEAPSTP